MIAVVQDGTVVEQGSHHQLLELGRRYGDLINSAELGAYWVRSGVADSSFDESDSVPAVPPQDGAPAALSA